MAISLFVVLHWPVVTDMYLLKLRKNVPDDSLDIAKYQPAPSLKCPLLRMKAPSTLGMDLTFAQASIVPPPLLLNIFCNETASPPLIKPSLPSNCIAYPYFPKPHAEPLLMLPAPPAFILTKVPSFPYGLLSYVLLEILFAFSLKGKYKTKSSSEGYTGWYKLLFSLKSILSAVMFFASMLPPAKTTPETFKLPTLKIPVMLAFPSICSPEALIVPATSSLKFGDVLPMPTFPEAVAK